MWLENMLYDFSVLNLWGIILWPCILSFLYKVTCVLKRMCVLQWSMLTLPIYEPGMFFHLFVVISDFFQQCFLVLLAKIFSYIPRHLTVFVCLFVWVYVCIIIMFFLKRKCSQWTFILRLSFAADCLYNVFILQFISR